MASITFTEPPLLPTRSTSAPPDGPTPTIIGGYASEAKWQPARLSAATIIAIIAGSLVDLAVVGIALWSYWKRRRRAARPPELTRRRAPRRPIVSMVEPPRSMIVIREDPEDPNQEDGGGGGLWAGEDSLRGSTTLSSNHAGPSGSNVVGNKKDASGNTNLNIVKDSAELPTDRGDAVSTRAVYELPEYTSPPPRTRKAASKRNRPRQDRRERREREQKKVREEREEREEQAEGSLWG